MAKRAEAAGGDAIAASASGGVETLQCRRAMAVHACVWFVGSRQIETKTKTGFPLFVFFFFFKFEPMFWIVVWWCVAASAVAVAAAAVVYLLCDWQ